MTESVYFHTAGPVRGILKPVSIPSKPPVPSRSRVNAVLGVGLVDQNPIGTSLLFLNEQVRSRDSGNSSLDSSGSFFVLLHPVESSTVFASVYIAQEPQFSLVARSQKFASPADILSPADPGSSLEWKLSVRSTIPTR